MITYLNGKLAEINPSFAVVDCAGVGYLVHISLTTFSKIEQQENVKLLTYHHVREDIEALYGFAEKSEREVFQRLLGVNGVGTATAMVMLSTLNAEELTAAIMNEDVKTLESIKGIGGKTAKRIILDLKDKLIKTTESEILTVNKENKIKFEALSALEVLGINKKAAEKQIQLLLKEKPNLSLEEVIKETLKKM